MLVMEPPSSVLEQARGQQHHRTLLPPVYLGDFRTALYRAMPNVRYHSCSDDGGIAHMFITHSGTADSWVVWWRTPVRRSRRHERRPHDRRSGCPEAEASFSTYCER